MAKDYLGLLKNKQYTAIINSKEYRSLLKDMCRRISSKAKVAPNEATIENYFDCELFAFFRDVFEPLGFIYSPVKEAAISTRRHTTKGRADTACTVPLHSECWQDRAYRQRADIAENTSGLILPAKSGGTAP